MASGFGIRGFRGRCYDLFMDFRECMTHCTIPQDCTELREDYYECLHHAKELKRWYRIDKERQRQEKEAAAKGAGGKEEEEHKS
ncbi:NADH dehydrogenase [ubiquinone] iron-sulfur protein 5-B-like [Selaginella moellendorffii]|uniref:NADH dehydrogenase [ubiquinone] iron-sulfur protein 5-B-like n=1 Tax=Selaginella moellendorffii TaxID=88036 RepID=UPI000D1CE40C|nr:NADH dehydrogenase [ubiquinone] iron-sulfur protein 5-B-like [Selaginella moellendorffii]XP_024540914.1 NADH dehydrogenase [ubiquinone] iron-sulfur protein 5-B-like [Selaginella moellendorffii]|eukprot:XP_024517023.1 NADH dehydrogenase [ubiquinone] iron-sulfur protein 5-B-like [Selaginella moellendorffii]